MKAVIGVVILVFSIGAAGATRVAIFVDPNTDAAKCAAVLESRLSDEPGVNLVERSQLDRIIQEQALQECFAADAVDRRARLGRLVQADVLVLLRTVSLPQSRLDMVVCESHHGLRLLTRIIPMSGNPAADAATAQQSIHEAILKSRQKITQIIAVPPMVCDDLSFEFAYLGSAYSRIIEQSLANRDGVFVAELTEARAVEKELQLGDRTEIDRPLPFYLLGRYANKGIGSTRQAEVTLTLKQGRRT